MKAPPEECQCCAFCRVHKDLHWQCLMHANLPKVNALWKAPCILRQTGKLPTIVTNAIAQEQTK